MRARPILPGLIDLMATLPLSPMVKGDLVRRMAEPHRHYHGLGHLDTLWRRHLLLRSETDFMDERSHVLVACAIAFHDAVFELKADDNETRSAELWLSVSETGQLLSSDDRLWVANTIIATADHGNARLDLRDPRQQCQQWVLDLDLSRLGEIAETFDENVALLHAEALPCRDANWNASLLRSLRHFTRLYPLYRSPPIARAFTEQAHQNLERHLARLTASH